MRDMWKGEHIFVQVLLSIEVVWSKEVLVGL